MSNETRVVPVELKPCPFCGSEPLRYDNGYATCPKYPCPMNSTVIESEAWNTRTQPAAPVTTQEPVCMVRSHGSSCWEEMSGESLEICQAEEGEYEVRKLYTHADAGEVERLRAEVKSLHEAGEFLDTVTQGVEDKLRAQLVERDALLRECAEFYDDGVGRSEEEWSLIQKLRDALSASADPSAPVDENAQFEKWRKEQISSLMRMGYPDAAKAFRDLGSVQWAGWQARAALERKP